MKRKKKPAKRAEVEVQVTVELHKVVSAVLRYALWFTLLLTS